MVVVDWHRGMLGRCRQDSGSKWLEAPFQNRKIGRLIEIMDDHHHFAQPSALPVAYSSLQALSVSS